MSAEPSISNRLRPVTGWAAACPSRRPERRGARARGGSIHPSRLAVAAAVGVVLLVAAPASAQPDNRIGRMEAGLADAAYTGTLIVLNIGLDLFPPSHGTVIKPPTIDAWGLSTLTWDSTRTATTLSDVGLALLSGVALFGPPTFELSLGEEALNGTLLGVEALATTGLVTFLLKNLTARARPTTMGPHGGEYNSFPSGHTSQSFAAATMLTIFAYEYDWLDDDTRWLVPTVSYGLAAATGYFRVASRRHWLTDVLVGAVVGTGVSYLTYTLRTGD